MATQASELREQLLATALRALLIVWRDPEDRRFVPVAHLYVLGDGTFAFEYRSEARSSERFVALDEYPDMARIYISSSLPVFFVNRIMSDSRPGYAQYLQWLGLAEAAAADLPIEVLVRTGGGRATDTFHVVDVPIRGEQAFESRFFVSGVRHVAHDASGEPTVRPGDRLELRPQPDNLKNPRAVIIDVSSGEQLGWVPDWLCGEVTELMNRGWSMEATAERVNSDAPARTRVLCRLVGAAPGARVDGPATATS